jgi:hypothetical protein
MRRRHLARGLAGLPDAEEPDRVESVTGEPVEFRVGEVVQGCRAAEFERQLRESDAGVDLNQRGIAWLGPG